MKILTIPDTHPDLSILCAKTGTLADDMRGACGRETEYNYLKVYGKRDWTEQEINALKGAIERANLETKEYRFELAGTSDFEVEFDNDRTWPASFSFKSYKK